jgi:hypothetical protein
VKITRRAEQLQRDIDVARADSEEKDSQIAQLEDMLVEYKCMLDDLEKENQVPDEQAMASAGTLAEVQARQTSVNVAKSSPESAAMSVEVKELLRQIEELKRDVVAARKAARGAGRPGTGYKDHVRDVDDDDDLQDIDSPEVRSVRQLEKELRAWKERAETVDRFRSR